MVISGMNAFSIFQKLFTTVLKSISMLSYVEKPKGETLVSCNVIFWFSCYSVFYASEDYQELNMVKSKVLVFKIAGNWESFPFQTRYLVKKIYFYMLCSSYTCSTCHIGSGLAW